MNERIRELAREAGLPTYNPEGIPTKLEKFAELIVLECAEFARQHNFKKADRSYLIHKAIKQHFEVEE